MLNRVSLTIHLYVSIFLTNGVFYGIQASTERLLDIRSRFFLWKTIGGFILYAEGQLFYQPKFGAFYGMIFYCQKCERSFYINCRGTNAIGNCFALMLDIVTAGISVDVNSMCFNNKLNALSFGVRLRGKTWILNTTLILSTSIC